MSITGKLGIMTTRTHKMLLMCTESTSSTDVVHNEDSTDADELVKNARIMENLLNQMTSATPSQNINNATPEATILNSPPVIAIIELNATNEDAIAEGNNVFDEREHNDYDYIPSETEQNESEKSEKEEEEEENFTKTKRSRSKRCETDERKWTKNINFKRREKGLEYKGKKKENEVWKYNIQKPLRKIKPRCNCKLSGSNKTKIKCFSINEEMRNTIFQNFWKLSWEEKKVFVNTLLTVKRTSGKRGKQSVSRRSTSTEYYLKQGYGTIRVCKKMFLNTLGVGEIAIKQWVKTNLVETIRLNRQQNHVSGI